LQDFTLISVPWMLNQKVSIYDADGSEKQDTGEYQRHGAEVVFVFVEFMRAKGLLHSDVEVNRRPDLELRFSQLTEAGQQFARFGLDKWMRSVDRAGLGKPVTPQGLERLWDKFARERN
jgi:hypothetical protein